MGLVQEELESARGFMFDLYPDSALPVLSRRNIALAEAMIANNPSYLTGWGEGERPVFGGFSYWFGRLREVLAEGRDVSESEYEEMVRHVVEEVDVRNSTHLNADKVGREVMRKRIADFGRAELVECLRDPEGSEYRLFHVLAARTKDSKGGRRNPSFASKFCHWACRALFEGEPEQDNYPVYDGVVRRALPLYIDHFGLDLSVPNDPLDYEGYCACVDGVIACADEPISRSGFDRLAWYYFRGRPGSA